MSDRDELTYEKLRYDLIQDVRDHREEILEALADEETGHTAGDTWAHELADGAVPVMNYDLATVLRNDLNLGYEVPDGEDNIWSVISMALYRRLYDVAENEIQKMRQEAAEDAEEEAEADTPQP